MKKVTIYSTPTCTYCNMAKDFFKENKIAYTEINVASDLEKRNEMIEKSGQMGVPVIDIGGQIMVGFNKPVLAKALGL
ncbi:glutaredoxin family protein [Patescibacteria group bacterium]|nr:MAG: glutaredoxin family protein [Patescibacteria group bacterium]